MGIWNRLTPTKDRATLRFRYLVSKGAVDRYGADWETPQRVERILTEMRVIETAGFSAYFIMLSMIMDFCRRESVPYGPGRGSVGGSYVCYLSGIHEMDSLEWELSFERFLNADRVSYPDVDIDVSQRHRGRVLQYIRDEFQREDSVVLQVAAFARMGTRSLIDNMLAAHSNTDPNAGATAELLRRCLPEGANITGGTKQRRELAWWLENGAGDKEGFRRIAEQAGWLDIMLKLDSVQQYLTPHAAGVVILNREDLTLMPQAGIRDSRGNWNTVTGYDMVALEALGHMKIDVLGLRTVDLITDASRLNGEPGTMEHCLNVWREHRDDPVVYELLKEADTTGIFQMETPGYRRTVKDFEPSCFEHIVQLNALYRPGALDYRREDGKNMVEVFIDRKHGREPVTFDHPLLEPILRPTYGIILYQEQAMAIARSMAGFSGTQADSLRKAIGKKKRAEMDKLMPLWEEGCKKNSIPDAVSRRTWKNIEAAARYSWNKSHSVFYGCLTWMTGWYKGNPELLAGFSAALLNSWQDKKERQANVLAEARQKIQIKPPDINIAQTDFVVSDGSVVFGLNGLRGMGPGNRDMILIDRMINGPFAGFEDFCNRLPSLGMDKKLSLVRCGAFDSTDDRAILLARIPRLRGDRTWTVAEHINHNRRLRRPRPLPPAWEMDIPTDRMLSAGERETIGFYISNTPLAEVEKALARMPRSNHFGGEIESIRKKRDKRNREMAIFTMLTPALNRQRVTVFSSVWDRYRDSVIRGQRVIIRGHVDGGSVLCDAIFDPSDVRHFARVKITRRDESRVEVLNGGMAQIQGLETAGYTVKLL